MLEDNYSYNFCFAICALMKGIEKYSTNILSLLSENEKSFTDPQIQKIIESAKQMKQLKEDEQKKSKTEIKK